MAPGKFAGEAQPSGFVFSCTVDCGNETVSFLGYDTAKEARQAAIHAAMKRGWQPPRWWQVWRWGSIRTNSLPRL